LKNQRGYDTIVVWDGDWRADKDLVLHKIENYLKERRNSLGEKYEC
jgi:hypothetical protein